MRKLVCILFLLTFVPTEVPAEMSVNLQNNFGYTLVNVSEAMDIPEYSDFNTRGLVEWDQFNYKGLIQVLFENKLQV